MFIPPCSSLHKVTFPRMQFRNVSYSHYDRDIHPRLVQSRQKLNLPHYDKYNFARLTDQAIFVSDQTDADSGYVQDCAVQTSMQITGSHGST